MKTQENNNVIKTTAENIQADREYALILISLLEKEYPEAECALHYEGEAWKLLVMARLSAQCTDARVNIVCKDLFSRFQTLESLANADVTEVENIIKSCGLYRMKAHDIVYACKMTAEVYNGVLPNTMEELLKLPGVGRKIANLLLGDIYSLPAVVVDTHCIRISRRLGLVPADITNPEKIERILSEIIPPEKQSDFCHRLVILGREHCKAQRYSCKGCPLSSVCRKVTI